VTQTDNAGENVSKNNPTDGIVQNQNDSNEEDDIEFVFEQTDRKLFLYNKICCRRIKYYTNERCL